MHSPYLRGKEQCNALKAFWENILNMLRGGKKKKKGIKH